MAIVFPINPKDGQIYPDPARPGVGQWTWDQTLQIWKEYPLYVKLRAGNFNRYDWPNEDGVTGEQLTTDGNGNLSWAPSTAPEFQLVGLLEPFNGLQKDFTLVILGTQVPYTPIPVSNIAVFVGGIPQIPNSAYTVNGSLITFTEAPKAGASFYAFSSSYTSPTLIKEHQLKEKAIAKGKNKIKATPLA